MPGPQRRGGRFRSPLYLKLAEGLLAELLPPPAGQTDQAAAEKDHRPGLGNGLRCHLYDEILIILVTVAGEEVFGADVITAVGKAEQRKMLEIQVVGAAVPRV